MYGMRHFDIIKHASTIRFWAFQRGEEGPEASFERGFVGGCGKPTTSFHTLLSEV